MEPNSRVASTSKQTTQFRSKQRFRKQWRPKRNLYSNTLPVDFVARGVLREEFVIVNDPDACSKLFHHGCFGTFRKHTGVREDGKQFTEYCECLLSAEESLYLAIESKQLVCRRENADVTVGDADLRTHFEQFSSSIHEKFLIYTYWRKKNFIVRSGFKFGVDYSVYTNHPDLTHARYAVKILYANENVGVQISYLKALTRIAGQVSKDLIFCMVENQEVKTVDPNSSTTSSAPNSISLASWGRFSFKY